MTETQTREAVRLPRWEAAHKDLNLEYVGEGFYEDVTDKTEEGYVVVDLEGHAPYLMMIHDGFVCEIGRVERTHENQNLGEAYVEVSSEEIKEALGREDGTVSVYELPEEVCMSVCKVINSRMRYGDLNTDIASIPEIFDRLEDDGFSGTLVFTNPSNYSYVEMRGGSVTDCWHRGDAACSTVEDLKETEFDEGLELNIFRKKDVESATGETADPAIEIGGDDEEGRGGGAQEIDYGGIAGALADAVAGMVGRGKFYENLGQTTAAVDGLDVEDNHLHVDNPDVESALSALRAATEASSKMTSVDNIIQKARDDIRRIEGGEEFLERYG